MADEVKFDIDGDAKGAEAAYKKVIRENEALRQKMIELGRTGKKVSDDSIKGANDQAKAAEAMGKAFANSMASAISGAALLTATLKLAGAEYNNIIARQQQASKTIIKGANADLSMARNLSAEDIPYWRQQAPGMAARSKSTIDVIKSAIGAASAAQGNLSRDQLRANVEMAAMVAPDSADEMTVIAGGLGDASRLTGSGDAQLNMGAILQMGKQARVKNTRLIAENLVPGAVSTMGYGGTATESMALLTTMSTLLGDQTGAITKTNTTAGAREMDRILGVAGSPLEHITAMQNDPKLRAKFLKGASLGESQIAWENLTTKGSAADQLLRKNLPEYGTGDQLKKTTEEWAAVTFNDGAQRLAALDRSWAMQADQLQNADLKGGTAGTVRDRLFGQGGFFQSSKMGAMDNQLTAWQFDAMTMMGRSPEGAAERILTDRKKTLGAVDFATPEKIAENKDVVQRLDTMIQEMRLQRTGPKPKNIDAHVE